MEQELRMQTCRDPTLSRVLELVHLGWQGTEVHPGIVTHAHHGNEITIHHEVLMWGSKVVLPAKLRERVLETLYTHWYDHDEGLVPDVCLVFGGQTSTRTNKGQSKTVRDVRR